MGSKLKSDFDTSHFVLVSLGISLVLGKLVIVNLRRGKKERVEIRFLGGKWSFF